MRPVIFAIGRYVLAYPYTMLLKFTALVSYRQRRSL